MKRKTLVYMTIAAAGLAIVAAGCGTALVKSGGKATAKSGNPGTSAASQPKSTVKQEAPVPPENNPPGDIPDSQVFVSYKPPDGSFEVRVPEGWSLATSNSGASFTDKLNTVSIEWAAGSPGPTPERADSVEVPQLAQSEAAFQLVGVEQVSLPAGGAVLIKYQKNSAPNQVTGKQYRMDVLRYEFFSNGKQVNLSLESPVGADNVDPWKTISESLKWL